MITRLGQKGVEHEMMVEETNRERLRCGDDATRAGPIRRASSADWLGASRATSATRRTLSEVVFRPHCDNVHPMTRVSMQRLQRVIVLDAQARPHLCGRFKRFGPKLIKGLPSLYVASNPFSRCLLMVHTSP